MKRFVLISMILFIFITAVSASTVYPSENDYYEGSYKKPENVTLTSGDKVNIGVSVNCTISSLPSFVTIGFVKSIPEGFGFDTEIPAETIISTLDLNDFDGDGKGNNNEGSAYVFYQIKSQMALTVSLGLRGLLEGTNDELGWTVSWKTPNATVNSQYSTGSVSYRENVGEEEHVSPIYKQAANSGGAVADYKELTVQTEDYRGKPVDTYIGYIYVNIAAYGV